jgi:hypothetical protein
LASCGLDDQGRRFSFENKAGDNSNPNQSNRDTNPPNAPSLDCNKEKYFYNELSFEKMDALLARYVDDIGFVDYKNWLKEPRDQQKLCEVMASFANADIKDFSYDEKFAFYVNAYNFATIDLILKNFESTRGDSNAPEPNTRSIRNIQGESGSPLGNDVWNEVLFEIAGESLSLNQIEHERLRKLDPVDARLHFAVNCASVGCPPLHDRAFRPAYLESTLEGLTEEFVNNGQRSSFDKTSNKIKTSMILNWFAEDFQKDPKYQGVRDFLKTENSPSRTGISTEELETFQVDFKSYDWSLNQSRD